MAKYAQNTTAGTTCPWGSVDDTAPTDAFTLAAQKAAAKRQEAQDTVHASSVVIAHGGADTGRVSKEESKGNAPPPSGRSSVKSAREANPVTGRSTASAKVKEAAVEKKMMSLIEQVLDKKVIELREELAVPKASKVVAPSNPSESAPSTSRTEASVVSAVSQMTQEEHEAVTMANKRANIKKLSDASLGKFDADQSRVAYLEMQRSAAEARNKNRSAICFDYEPEPRAAPKAPKAAAKASKEAPKAAKVPKVKMPKEPKAEEAKPGYEALERYPALLKEINDLSGVRRDAPEGLTSNGKQKQAMKLSDASLGNFDADESRLAYLEMQKSAAEARNKNRSALCFGDETGSGDKKVAASKDVTMAEKREKAKKLSDASLGKFDADASQIAYLDMQNTAAEMRNKNRVGQGIF
eukprot:s35_g53.t1